MQPVCNQRTICTWHHFNMRDCVEHRNMSGLRMQLTMGQGMTTGL